MGAQGYPVTTQLPGGPPLPDRIDSLATDLKYPNATGEIELREVIASYYNKNNSAHRFRSCGIVLEIGASKLVGD